MNIPSPTRHRRDLRPASITEVLVSTAALSSQRTPLPSRHRRSQTRVAEKGVQIPAAFGGSTRRQVTESVILATAVSPGRLSAPSLKVEDKPTCLGVCHGVMDVNENAACGWPKAVKSNVKLDHSLLQTLCGVLGKSFRRGDEVASRKENSGCITYAEEQDDSPVLACTSSLGLWVCF